MADNPPSKSRTSSLPPLPSSGMTGKLKSPTTQLPVKKGGPGKIVVMLSSVAKPAPATTQAIQRLEPDSGSPPKVIPANSSQNVDQPPPLPPKEVTPGSNSPPQSRLSTTTYVKLPPKTSIPRLGALSTMPLASPSPKESLTSKVTPPPLPAKWSEPKKSGPQHIPPIKLNEASVTEDSAKESIFPEPDKSSLTPKPAGWKSLEPGELNPPSESLESLEVFARSQQLLDKPESKNPLPEAKPAPMIAPPLLHPNRAKSAEPTATTSPSLRPPPLPPPVTKIPEPVTPPSAPVVHAPPLIEKVSESISEKLPPPLNLPVEPPKSETTPDVTAPSSVHKVPALVQPDLPAAINPPPHDVPAKALSPTAPAEKIPSSWLKKSKPLVLSSTARVEIPRSAEAKLAVKPAVLPKRLQPPVKESEEKALPTETEPSAKADAMASAAAISPVVPPLFPTAKEPSQESEKPGQKSLLGATPPVIPTSAKAKESPKLTRAERAKKRRFMGAIIFWVVLLPLTVAALFLGSLRFGRDTRVEGQVIPPSGMPLNNEVWIVTDFSSLASGIAEDLAAERAPLMQEIQERQDHVQRAQADIASREERIRLIQQDMQSAKQDIDTVIKQSRDETQQIWDVDGAEIDSEYQTRFDQLKATIADRAKSLNLKYQPDPDFPSPEVWANAYRLALYEVPPGVDTVKEHQWLSDQMKQWRDFVKSLDDRKEQLREKAAQVKLAPAPKIADLNSKIDGLQQRIDATEAEEAPLKTELQQAQQDLSTAQDTEAGLDDKYYKQLESLPGEAITKRISLRRNGRFTWVDDDVFAEGEKERHYYIFARATRADGRQYWALHDFSLGLNQTLEVLIEPAGFVSTKAILRPDLSPEEQEQ